MKQAKFLSDLKALSLTNHLKFLNHTFILHLSIQSYILIIYNILCNIIYNIIYIIYNIIYIIYNI